MPNMLIFSSIKKIFEKYSKEYDQWFDKNIYIYKSELMCLRKVIPSHGIGIDIGIGTGRFASELGIKIGLDPALNMLSIAKKRGIYVINGIAEALPFKKGIFDFVLINTVLSFLENPISALKEIQRILRKNGYIILGIIDRKSKLARFYESKKEKSKFYKYAKFLSVKEVIDLLTKMQFKITDIYQTIFFEHPRYPIINIQPPKKGYGIGGFVVIRAYT